MNIKLVIVVRSAGGLVDFVIAPLKIKCKSEYSRGQRSFILNNILSSKIKASSQVSISKVILHSELLVLISSSQRLSP